MGANRHAPGYPTRGIIMKIRHSAGLALGCALALGLWIGAAAAAATDEPSRSPLGIASGRVSIAGTSNIHAYTATTTAVRVRRLQIAEGVSGPNMWDGIVKPGAVEAFEVAIPAATLSSPKDGLDKNMHKALKVTEHPDIVFRLLRFEPRPGAPGALRAIGVLQIAGVERNVSLDVTTERTDVTLTVQGALELQMTDYGIKPPTAMLGMLKTDPKVTVTFETVLTTPLT
jgi:polyisoprenoid-binding protein YceI